jgi:hypothetical protein
MVPSNQAPVSATAGGMQPMQAPSMPQMQPQGAMA